MKLSKYLVGTLACALMAACSNEENVGSGSSGQEEGQLSYVAVNIVNANPTGSRVAGATYDDGTDDENEITKARFYLFKDDTGTAYELANSVQGWSANYVEKNDLSGTTLNPEDDNVEEIVNATLVFQGKNAELPTSIVAILNPPTTLGTSKLSLSELQNKIENYGASTKGNFIMTNSVYATGSTTKTKVVATNIVGKVAASEADAKANPVDIYVERVVAKVQLKLTGTESGKENQYKVTEESTTPAVYAKVLGWAVTTDNRISNLLKDINTSWTDTGLGFTWNDEPYFRSYWATTPSSITPTNDKTAKEIIEENKPTSPEGATNISIARYCQENTLASTHTNIIVVAQLVNENGDAQPTYKYYGENYTSENDILTLIANKYANVYYTKTTSSDGDVYTSIAPTDMHFVATSASTGGADYESVAVLNNNVTIYTPNPDYDPDTAGSQPYNTVETASVNTELAKNPAQIAKDGYVYYFTPIKHLGTTGKTGEYGVVRNHIYDVTISDIKGFGTPIYNPDKDIIPTEPQDRETYIAARINILSWRVVNMDNVTLGK